MTKVSAAEALALLDWKRHIFDLYDRVRFERDPLVAWTTWRATRDQLFKTHSQSPIPKNQRGPFDGCSYFDYDASYRVEAEVSESTPESYEIVTSGDTTMRFTRIGTAKFEFARKELALEMYWLNAYAGGLFVPFRDETSGTASYGAGRYLLDTVKGADLGTTDGRLILDFNFAYNPSCAYDPRWVCPLATPANRLPVAIEAGEKAPAPNDSSSS